MIIDIDPEGFVRADGHRWRCALGRGGVGLKRREGDGVTPVGTWRLGRVFHRADRIDPPQTGLDVIALKPDHGWCDDPQHPDYNQLITLPHPARHECMWRDDELYDVVVEVLFNTDPIVAGLGSAIFIHVAKPKYAATEGCVALNLNALLKLLRICNKGDVVHITAP